jgi:dihydroxy-acid dehydratase
MRGNMAPESCVLKVSGKDIKEFRGPAKCYDGENTAYDGIQNGELEAGDVLIIRYDMIIISYDGPKSSYA